MRPAASESNPANPIAGSWLAVFGSLRGSAGGAAAGAGVGSGAGVGRCRRRRCRRGCRCRRRFGGMTTGTILNDTTSSSRRLSGFLPVSLSSLPVISTQRPSIASVILPFSGLSSVRASAPGSAVHDASGTLATGPFLGRASTYLSAFPPRTALPEPDIPPRSPARSGPAAAGSHPVAARMRVRPSPHRKRRQRPLHHRDTEEPSEHLLSPWAATTDPLVTHAANIPFRRSAQTGRAPSTCVAVRDRPGRIDALR